MSLRTPAMLAMNFEYVFDTMRELLSVVHWMISLSQGLLLIKTMELKTFHDNIYPNNDMCKYSPILFTTHLV